MGYLPIPYFSHDTKSYGFSDMTKRIPSIISRVVENIKDYQLLLVNENKHAEKIDIDKIIELVEKVLKHLEEAQNFTNFSDSYPDYVIWNQYLSTAPRCNEDISNPVSWLTTSSLYSECYYYRAIFECFQTSVYHKKFDYFAKFKREILSLSLNSLLKLGKEYFELFNTPQLEKHRYISSLHHFLLHSMWNNKLDLSLTGGRLISSSSIFDLSPCEADIARKYLLSNDMEIFLNYISSLDWNNPDRIVHIVLDNCGSEFFADMCLGLYFLDSGISTKVIYHAKCLPWFVSDVTLDDVDYTMSYLKNIGDVDLSKIVTLVENYKISGKLEFRAETIWTTPLPYCQIVNENCFATSSIYQEFRRSILVIFKGDLNYSKLLGDLSWPYTTLFTDALGDFKGFPILVLRTIKSDCVVGLSKECFNLTDRLPDRWQETGDYGIIQFNRL